MGRLVRSPPEAGVEVEVEVLGVFAVESPGKKASFQSREVWDS